MKNSMRWASAAILLALGCAPDARVDIPVGPIRSTVDLPVSQIPSALIGSDGRLITIACSSTTTCPTASGVDVSIACVNDRCTLGAFTARTPNQVVDLSTVSDFQQYAGSLNLVSLERAQLGFTGLSAGNVVGPLALSWSAESDVDGASSRVLATLPRTTLTSPTQEISLALDSAEVPSLARAVLEGTRRFRVRISGPVEAGEGALPSARVELSLRLVFHIDTSP